MPLKSGESLVQRYPRYLNSERVERLANKLARFTFFGESILARSTISGGPGKHPLNPNVLMQLKQFIKQQFPMESPTNFEAKWSKCVDSINRHCKYVYKEK